MKNEGFVAHDIGFFGLLFVFVETRVAAVDKLSLAHKKENVVFGRTENEG